MVPPQPLDFPIPTLHMVSSTYIFKVSLIIFTLYVVSASYTPKVSLIIFTLHMVSSTYILKVSLFIFTCSSSPVLPLFYIFAHIVPLVFMTHVLPLYFPPPRGTVIPKFCPKHIASHLLFICVQWFNGTLPLSARLCHYPLRVTEAHIAGSGLWAAR